MKIKKIKKSETQLMVEFALRWQPWGGASDEDIMIHFGLPATTFYRRVFSIVDREQVHVEPRKALQLKSMCAAKLCQPLSPASPTAGQGAHNTPAGTKPTVDCTATGALVEAHRAEETKEP